MVLLICYAFCNNLAFMWTETDPTQMPQLVQCFLRCFNNSFNSGIFLSPQAFFPTAVFIKNNSNKKTWKRKWVRKQDRGRKYESSNSARLRINFLYFLHALFACEAVTDKGMIKPGIYYLCSQNLNFIQVL